MQNRDQVVILSGPSYTLTPGFRSFSWLYLTFVQVTGRPGLMAPLWLSRCMMLGKLLDFFKDQFPHLPSGDTIIANDSYRVSTVVVT